MSAASSGLEGPREVYITYAEAAELLEVATSTLSRLIVAGRLDSRGQRGAGVGSLRRDEVEALRHERDVQRRAATQRRLERERRPRGPQPPDRDHDWLRASEAAAAVGVTVQAIRQQCVRGTLPSVFVEGRWWIRRDHLELRQRARAAQASRVLTSVSLPGPASEARSAAAEEAASDQAGSSR